MVDKVRTFALVAHSGAGKTSLAEAIFFDAGITTRIGRVEDGNTIMDFEPEEIKRQTSISSAFNQFSWKKHTLNIIDTPGDSNFFSDTKNCMSAADGVVLVVDGVDGAKVQTELGLEFAEEFKQPVLIVINKLDKDRSDFTRVVSELAELIELKPIPIQIPIGREASFIGVVDLLNKKAYTYDDKGKSTPTEIPPELQDIVEEEMEAFIENVAEADDELLERYLEGEEITTDEIKAALRKGVIERAFAPVVCVSATKNIGVDLLLDNIVELLPSPADRGAFSGVIPDSEEKVERLPDPEEKFSGFVFKTVVDPYAGRLSIFRVVSGTLPSDGTIYNSTKGTKERYNQLLQMAGKEQRQLKEAGPGSIVAVAKLKDTTTGDSLCDESAKVIFPFPEPLPHLISYAVEPKNKGDEDKVFISLSKLLEEDAALKITRKSETREILLSGRGQVHIEATVDKLKRKYNVEVELKIPKVPYRETIRRKVRVQGKHKKQTGGHGQYGDCWIQMEPLPRGEGFQFVDAIVGGSIPKGYIPAVEKGIVESAQKGPLAGFPCIDFKVTLDDGSYHTVDSSEMAFKIAGSLAFRKAAVEADPVLLEPIMKVSVITPEEFMGDIMGDLNSRRGRVLGMDSKGKNQVINAYVPLAEILTYAPDLTSMTGGRGIFSMEFSHYDEVPQHLAQKIIDEARSQEQ